MNLLNLRNQAGRVQGKGGAVMFCQKCGKQIPDSSVFCNFCGASVQPGTAPNAGMPMPSNETPARRSGGGKTALKWVGIIAGVLIVLILILAMMPDDDQASGADDSDGKKSAATDATQADADAKQDAADDADTGGGDNADSGDSAGGGQSADADGSAGQAGTDADGANGSGGALTQEAIQTAIAQSGSAVISLAYRDGTDQSLPQEFFDLLIPALGDGALKALDAYPYLFVPEYHITLDGGVGYGISQEAANDRCILRFDGDDTLYEASYEVFRNSNEIATEDVDDMGNLQVYVDSADEESAIDSLVRGKVLEHYVWNAVVGDGFSRNLNLAFNNSIDEVFRIDEMSRTLVPDTDPGLSFVDMEYSLKPAEMPDLSGTPALWLEDGWMRGNHMIVAFWTDRSPDVPRVYMIGVQTVQAGMTEEDTAIVLFATPRAWIDAAAR